MYWRDSGLLHSLLNVADDRALLSQPWVGASWEGFAIEQVLGRLSAIGRSFGSYYFRTSDRYELDLVLELGTERWAIEIKLTSSPSTKDLSRLDKTADLIDASPRFLISQTRRQSGGGRRVSCDMRSLLDYLRENELRTWLAAVDTLRTIGYSPVLWGGLRMAGINGLQT